jgi:hypothetical protein
MRRQERSAFGDTKISSCTTSCYCSRPLPRMMAMTMKEVAKIQMIMMDMTILTTLHGRSIAAY